MNKELQPCPFCGGEAKIIHANDVTLPYRIRCKNINCDVRPSTTWFKHKEDAITKWNTRKPIDKVVEQLDKCANEEIYLWASDEDDYDENGKLIIHKTTDLHMYGSECFDKAIEIVKGGAE